MKEKLKGVLTDPWALSYVVLCLGVIVILLATIVRLAV